jgi:hypothetical protein
MERTLSEQRLIANEIIQRDENEKANLKLHHILASDDKILFICECSRKECKDRIGLTNKQFYDFHRDRTHFVIMPDHQVTDVERVVTKTDDYYIVEKFADIELAEDDLGD